MKASFNAFPSLETVDNGGQSKASQLFGQLDAASSSDAGEAEADGAGAADGAFDFLEDDDNDEDDADGDEDDADGDADFDVSGPTLADEEEEQKAAAAEDPPKEAEGEGNMSEEDMLKSFGAAGAKMLKRQSKRSKSKSKTQAKDLFSDGGGGGGSVPESNRDSGLADLFDLGPGSASGTGGQQAGKEADSNAQAAKENVAAKKWKNGADLRSHIDAVQVSENSRMIEVPAADCSHDGRRGRVGGVWEEFRHKQHPCTSARVC